MGNKSAKHCNGAGIRCSSLRPIQQKKHGQWSLSVEDGPVLRKSSSSGCIRNHSIDEIPSVRDRSASESQGVTRPNKDRKLRSGISVSAQALINSSFENAHEDTARRVYSRMMQMRADFAVFYKNLSKDDLTFMVDGLKTYLTNVVAHVGDTNQIKKLSEEFGARHVQLRSSGFKPDFFSTTADAITTECVFLDHAVHPTSETFKAWTALFTIMFSSVRDGYYAEVRRVRRLSHCFSASARHSSLDLSSDSDSEVSLSLPPENCDEQGATRERMCLSVVAEERADCHFIDPSLTPLLQLHAMKNA